MHQLDQDLEALWMVSLMLEVLMKKSEETQQEMQKKIEALMKEYLCKLDLPSKEELKEITQRLENIEKRLETLSQK